MRTCSEIELPGGACCLDEIGGANEELNAASDLSTDAATAALKFRSDSRTELTVTTDLNGSSGELRQCAQDAAG